MNDVFICYIIGDEHGKPGKGKVTVLTFIAPSEERGNALAALAASEAHDATGLPYLYLVEPLPYVSAMSEGALHAMAREAALEAVGDPVPPSIVQRATPSCSFCGEPLNEAGDRPNKGCEAYAC